MPPKKTMRTNSGKAVPSKDNPRVVIKPLKGDSSGSNSYRLITQPPTAAIYNKEEFSDLKVRVGETCYFCHRLILRAGSDVFAKMLDEEWLKKGEREIVLNEEQEHMKAVKHLLFYLYTGQAKVTDSNIVPLFMLADKYNVKPLYEECMKLILKGLKVFIATRSRPVNIDEDLALSTSSNGSGSSISEFSDSEPEEEGKLRYIKDPQSLSARMRSLLILVASETFPTSLVMKILMLSHNEKLSSAALFNLEARLSSLFRQGNYTMWKELDKCIVVRMLEDKYFYLNEFMLFQAAIQWLKHKPERKEQTVLAEILCLIKYPILQPEHLYRVEKEELVRACPQAMEKVQMAIRYQLFRSCCDKKEKEQWKGHQFEYRVIKEESL